MAGYLAAAKVFHLLFRQGRAFSGNDEGTDFLAVFSGGDGGNLYVLHAFKVVEKLLYLAGIDVFASAYNHVFDATRDAIVACLVLDAQVAAVQPAVGVDNLGGGLRVFVVAFHGKVAATAHFALCADGTFPARFGVDDGYFRAGIFLSHRRATFFKTLGEGAVRHAGRGLRQSVHARDAGDVHLLGHAAHQLNRAEGACHNPRPQGSQVEQVKHRMIQFGNKHGRHAVQSRTPFLVHGSEHHQRVEAFNHHLRTAVRQHIHACQRHAEAMKERHAATQFVVRRKAHALAGEKAVVGNIMMRQHDSLREAGRAGSILHIDDVAAVHLPLRLNQFRIADVLPEQ
ncbi:hypothetical protein Barb7_01313 [Bacteroidales bacterium Barb7]|nr:hypothetical protein Barb7_01313 [Bacteroidales bacterium Barb7]